MGDPMFAFVQNLHRPILYDVTNAVRIQQNLFEFDILSSDVMPIVKCPHCGRETEYSGNEFRPFCSERCKLLDFGAWAEEQYKIPIESESLSDEDVDAIERALENDPNDHISRD